MEYSLKFRIYPNKKQEVQIAQTLGCARFVYNYFLALKKETYETEGKNLSFAVCCKELTALKKTEAYKWLQDVDATALQQSLRDLDRACQNFFRGLKKGQTAGFPKFKRKHASRQTYRTQNNQSKSENGVRNTITLYDDCIRLPKLGYVKCRVSKKVTGRILSATVSKTSSGKYFVSVCWTDADIPQSEPTGAVCGIDLGIKELATLSDGTVFANHKHLRKSEKKLRRLQRELSRKTKGSRNREKARMKLARQHEKVRNQRRDALHKMTTQIVRDYDVICTETLKSKNMMQNHKLAKAVGEASFYEVIRQLQYKCDWYGKLLIRIDLYYPSSQLCSSCGYQNPNTKDLSVREWTCPKCGVHHDRDLNAAQNILDEGLRLSG